ncbi:MAG: hypothetical protein QME68_00670 [Elusimicrobiota bacterium]|nr:hypothetical protein [Elusimicrobiota bacterium]
MWKKIVRVSFFVLTAMLLLTNVGQLFAAIDVSTGVPAMATVSLLSQMSIEARNRVSHGAVSSVSWDNVSAGITYALPQAYIVVSATSNRIAWKIDIYTKNVPRVSTNTATGVYQCAGLYNTDAPVGTTDFIRLPLLWIVSKETLTTLNLGDSSVKNTVYGSTCSVTMGWMYMKDKGDQNDPHITGDQSWTGAHQAGYTVVLYGGPNYRNLPVGIATGNPNYVYVECDFSGATGGKSYETTIWFDLYY